MSASSVQYTSRDEKRLTLKVGGVLEGRVVPV